MGFIEKMKNRWGVSGWGMIAILIAYSLAGPTIVLIKKNLFSFFHVEHAHIIIKILFYIFIMFPLYQILVICYGSLLGQYTFFRKRLQKMMLWIRRKFILKKSL